MRICASSTWLKADGLGDLHVLGAECMSFGSNRVDTFMSVKHVDVKPRLQRELFYTDLMFLLESGSGLRILSLRIPQGLVRNSCSDK